MKYYAIKMFNVSRMPPVFDLKSTYLGRAIDMQYAIV